MELRAASAITWLFQGQRSDAYGHLIPRWLFLRAIAVIYFSAFFSLIFQIRGLIGPSGILPAATFLKAVANSLGPWQRFWYVPTLYWFSSSHLITGLCWLGMLAAVALLLNVWPRAMLIICFVCFLSFISAAQDFSSYQSDGMLLEAGFICLFFAPAGLWPRLGNDFPPSRAALFLLRWEWFRIYFESGAVKILSGDPQWRNFTAMDEYYQNGPLPTWIGWYVQHLPHWFHAGVVYATLALELGLVWMLFLPRRWRIVCFVIATTWQIPVILTANYAFLNYLVLSLGILLVDDRFLLNIIPEKWRSKITTPNSVPKDTSEELLNNPKTEFARYANVLKLTATAIMLSWIFYATTAQLIWMFSKVPLPASPVTALEPLRIANSYGLFAVMTRGRYEIEFQGSNDGQNWVAYPFRYKPQRLDAPSKIFAPYQPRFDWNLWFASLGPWREYPIVPSTEVRLLSNDNDVQKLFADNPFSQQAPQQIRVVFWQYWFTTMKEKRETGLWWKRELLGLYAPTLERGSDGTIRVVEWPNVPPRQ